MTTTLQNFSQELATLIAGAAPVLVAIGGGRQKGRGFAATGIHWQDRYIITSAEAIPSKDSLILTLPDQSTCRVDRFGTDPTTDIAVFKLPGEVELPSANLSTESLAVGNLAVAVGRNSDRGIFAHLGMISQLNGPWQSFSGGDIDQLICVDVNLTRGGAGSALVDMQGRVIGFNTFGPRRTILNIPAQTINRVLKQLQQKGHVNRGYLGLGMQSVALPESLKQQHDLSNTYGVMIINIEPGKSAEQAGIVLGDILVSFNEQMVQDPRDIQTFLTPQSIGKNLEVQLIRGGGLQHINVTVGER
jgi:S1-C subfamily serine protease